MTNDSGRFRTRAELEEKEGAWRVEGNLYDGPSGSFVPSTKGRWCRRSTTAPPAWW